MGLEMATGQPVVYDFDEKFSAFSKNAKKPLANAHFGGCFLYSYVDTVSLCCTISIIIIVTQCH